MLWVAYCIDNENTKETRDRFLAVHREYLDANANKIFFSGPLQSDDASFNNGSIFVLNVASRSDAEAFVQNEPFYKNGVFADVRVSRTREGRFFPENIG